MLDIETLGVRPGAVVASIGAVYFDPWSTLAGDTFYSTIDIVSAQNAGMKIYADTIKWWAVQSDNVRVELTKDTKTLTEVLSEFRWFLRAAGEDLRIWGHGSHFDIPLLEAAYNAIGHEAPWHYRAPRDTRTVYDLAGLDGKPPKVDADQGVQHNALDDARFQVKEVQRAIKLIHRPL